MPGTGVFLASHPAYIPSALIRNFEHNKIVHERILVLNFQIVDTPRQSQTDRARVQELAPGVFAITARFGFMETPDVREALRACRSRGLRVYLEDCSFFIGQHVVVARPRPGWQGLKRRAVCAAAASQRPGHGVFPHAGARYHHPEHLCRDLMSVGRRSDDFTAGGGHREWGDRP